MVQVEQWQPDDVVSFGSFRLVPVHHRLEYAGHRIEVGDRAFDLLLALIEQSPQIVSKTAILKRVWPNITVTESNIRAQMALLRKSLGSAGSRYVSTIQGRGYRFTAPISRSKLPGAVPVPMPPAVASVERARRGNLPPHREALIGRASELEELSAHFRQSRLVTLTGPGGIGKTSLALALGSAVSECFPGGVWLNDLAPLADPLLVSSTVATALGARLSDGRRVVDAIAESVGPEPALLIFDNCEHVLSAAAGLIEDLLSRLPRLAVLATSQEILRVPGELAYRLSPLALPPADATEVAGFGAVALFVERAGAANRRFMLEPGNAAAVAEICRRLDGLPLALEMAAARLSLLGIEGLRQRLDERLRMLTVGSHGAALRHRTLRNMVEWSYALLDEGDRLVFRRLAVFAGSFSLDAAIAVAGEPGAEDWDVIDALGRLVDKSLVSAEIGGQPRYRLLETLRLHAGEELRRSGEYDTTAARHAAYFTALFEQSETLWEAMPEADWVALHRPEIDNLRSALDWALAAAERAPVAVALAGAAALLWQVFSLLAEGRRSIERAAAVIDASVPLPAIARLFRHGGSLWANSDRIRALDLLERAVALYRTLDRPLELASLLGSVGNVYDGLGRPADAKAALQEAEALLAGSDRKRSLFKVMTNLGTLAGSAGATQEARQYFTLALKWARALEDTGYESFILMNFAQAEFVSGAVDTAIETVREAIEGLRRLNRRSFLGKALINLGSYLISRGDLGEAREVAEEALAAAAEEGGFILRVCLRQWALLAALEGDCRAAAELVGFTDGASANADWRRRAGEEQLHAWLMERLDAALAPREIAALAAKGACWTEAEAVAFAANRLIGHRLAPFGNA